MKIRKIATLILALVMACAILSACGGNEADKAYESWTANSVPKEKAAGEALAADFKAAQEQDDRAAMVSALETYLGIAKPIKDQLSAIDKTKLSDKYKSVYDAELAKIDESIKSLEGNLVMQKEILAEEQGAPAPAQEEIMDEEVYDEIEEEE